MIESYEYKNTYLGISINTCMINRKWKSWSVALHVKACSKRNWLKSTWMCEYHICKLGWLQMKLNSLVFLLLRFMKILLYAMHLIFYIRKKIKIFFSGREMSVPKYHIRFDKRMRTNYEIMTYSGKPLIWSGGHSGSSVIYVLNVLI